LIPSLDTMLDWLRTSLTARKVTVASIPPDLARNWVSADGRARIEVAPAGDPNDNDTLIRFAKAVRTIDPAAMGEPIAVQESGNTVVKAFIEAGLWALLSISLLLVIVLRRITDVLLTLVPLLLAGVVTLEITVLIDLPLNFANIIALPVLLGLGVAFKIYFVMAWRAGNHESSAIEPHARRLFQRNDHRDRVRQPLAVQASGHIQHGKATRFVACLHLGGGDFVPARADGAAEEGQSDERTPERLRGPMI
jgi:hypothetical protein